MARHRRHNRLAVKQIPRKLDTAVTLFGYTQDTMDWKTWRYRTVSLRKVAEMVLANEAEIVRRKTENGIVEFYKETKPSRIERTSPCTLTMATMHAVARSEERLTAGERAHVAKFRVWAFEGRCNAVLVRPRTDARDLVRAEQVFAEAKGRIAKVYGNTPKAGIRAEYYDALANSPATSNAA